MWARFHPLDESTQRLSGSPIMWYAAIALPLRLHVAYLFLFRNVLYATSWHDSHDVTAVAATVPGRQNVQCAHALICCTSICSQSATHWQRVHFQAMCTCCTAGCAYQVHD